MREGLFILDHGELPGVLRYARQQRHFVQSRITTPGETFVTRKITRAVASIKAGLQEKLYLGNLDAKRDWGYAKEYVEAMWRMLQQDKPDDYVIATNEAHSVLEFLDLAFAHAGLNCREYVGIDPQYCRPAEADLLVGDYTKARRELGWEPRTRFEELVRLMVDADMEELRRQRAGEVWSNGEEIAGERILDH